MPELSSVRFRPLLFKPVQLAIAPPGRRVWPEPLIEPPDQLNVPVMSTSPLPWRMPLESVKLVRLSGALKFTVAPLIENATDGIVVPIVIVPPLALTVPLGRN